MKALSVDVMGGDRMWLCVSDLLLQSATAKVAGYEHQDKGGRELTVSCCFPL